MFGKSKQQDAPKGDAAKASKSVNFEISIADIARRSEKRAWMVAGAAIVMSLILAGGYFYMLPLKKIEPYMIMADAYTGNAYVAKLEGDYVYKSLTTQEAVQKSNVTRYIIGRESFEYNITPERDWDAINLMSEGGVADTYSRMHASDNPEAPARVFGRDRALRIKVTSVVLSSRGTAESPIYGAEADIERILYDKRTGENRLLDKKKAFLEFVYNNNLAMTDAQRVDNPLGFRVTSYRIDNDASGAPAVGSLPAAVLPADPYALTGGQAAQGQVLPGQPAPGQVVPGQPLPGQPVPPGQAVPGQAAPAQPVPGQPAPAQPQQPGQQVPQFGAPTQPAAQPQPQPTAQPTGVR